MRAPLFWAEDGRLHPAARLLEPFGRLYGGLTTRRMDRPGERAPCPVICIGNVTLGGAGKTPTAARIATTLRDLGESPVLLTRGYGGSLAGPVPVDPALHDASSVGDEPLLLARLAPTIVARDRPAGARVAAESGASVIVMDDGLQNPSLAKDLSLAVLDTGFGIGNGRVFPAGPLRASLESHWRHLGGIVLIGAETPRADSVAREARSRDLAVHRGILVPEAAEYWRGRPVVAFAGIGRPEKFFATLRDAGAEIRAERSFPDHHPYRKSDVQALVALALSLDAELVTTAKDHVRLPPAFAERVGCLKVELLFEDETALRRQLSSVLAPARPS